jgi:hypothetical protein
MWVVLSFLTKFVLGSIKFIIFNKPQDLVCFQFAHLCVLFMFFWCVLLQPMESRLSVFWYWLSIGRDTSHRDKQFVIFFQTIPANENKAHRNRHDSHCPNCCLLHIHGLLLITCYGSHVVEVTGIYQSSVLHEVWWILEPLRRFIYCIN